MTMNNNKELIRLENITIRSVNKTIFSSLSFTVNEGENWALLGESGSGKTALLQALSGSLNIVLGSVTYNFYEKYLKEHSDNDPSLHIQQLIGYVPQKHTFKNLSNTTEFYYQQRYNSFDSEDAPTVQSYLSTINGHATTHSIWSFEYTVRRLELATLLRKELIKLSNGETRRVLIAAALLKKPKLLLLDNPLTGLDVETRPKVHELIDEIIRSGINVILATSPKEIPVSISHIAILKEGKILTTVRKDAFTPTMLKPLELKRPDKGELTSLLSMNKLSTYQYVVKMERVCVKYGSLEILNNIDWKVNQGDRWALTGPNGAGKSTLLSLINGDNPQAYANRIVLFDKKRGSGESIWDIKKNIGFVSPELFQYFKTGSTCIQVVESGFYDTLGLFRKSSVENYRVAERWMNLLELAPNINSSFNKVSASVQRLCLLARALVKDPPLLILDEPCQGLDEHQKEYFKLLIDEIAALRKITIIYVSHYQEELPTCVNKILRLELGRVINSNS